MDEGLKSDFYPADIQELFNDLGGILSEQDCNSSLPDDLLGHSIEVLLAI